MYVKETGYRTALRLVYIVSLANKIYLVLSISTPAELLVLPHGIYNSILHIIFQVGRCTLLLLIERHQYIWCQDIIWL
jgi:hypothetical protein